MFRDNSGHAVHNTQQDEGREDLMRREAGDGKEKKPVESCSDAVYFDARKVAISTEYGTPKSQVQTGTALKENASQSQLEPAGSALLLYGDVRDEGCDPEKCLSPERPSQEVHFRSANIPANENRPTTFSESPVASLTPEAPKPETTYPEGGFQAYSVVLGSFAAMTAAFGLVNTVGTFQAYLSTHQLVSYDPSVIGWIFGLYVFLAFFCGLQIGPVFDAKGPKWLIAGGSLCMLGTAFGLAESTSMLYEILQETYHEYLKSSILT